MRADPDGHRLLLLLAGATMLFPGIAAPAGMAAVYKCTNADGSTSYSDVACSPDAERVKIETTPAPKAQAHTTRNDDDVAESQAVGNPARDQTLAIPLTDTSGTAVELKARVCRPAGDRRAALVLINHGSPPHGAERARVQLGRCEQEAARWFLQRGYVVAFVLRRGYGATGGPWVESYGSCANPDYVRAGIESAHDINAAVEYLTALPFVNPSGAIVVGQSAGGWGTIAYDSLAHPRVAAFVVMAGGRGGHQEDAPDHNCNPQRLAQAAGHFGATASTPMLWIYAINDSYFGPAIAQALWRAFTAAGGRADLKQPAAYDGDGHRLFNGPGGAAIWGPLVADYLEEHSPQ
jgi:dienelactone hydrolase